MKSSLTISILFLSIGLFAAENKYPVSDIPDSLKNGMYAVIREESNVFTILDKSHSNIQYHYVITILKATGRSNAILSVGYDKLTKIKSVKATVYDALGNVVKKVKTSDFIDQSSISGFSIYEDNRQKYIDLRQASYPYTIEFEYELDLNYLLFIPSFYLYDDDEVSIQKKSYQLVYPTSLKPRYRGTFVDDPEKQILSGKESLLWTFNNFVPKKFEAMSPTIEKYIPRILVAPVDFEYDGYAGTMNSWENFGKWQLSLNKGRDEILPETIEKVKSLTKDVNDDREKVKILYKYLQNKTRYVSIQLGIGGWQPFEALTVDKLSYGDCKALSNYMISLLKAADINGYYTVIYGGSNPPTVLEDFPKSYFNHVIVTVPLEKDTVWLECTSQQNPFGYLGNFTGNRSAMMVTEDGARLIKTPVYKGENNQQLRSAEVILDVNGNAQAQIQTIYSGLQIENDGLDSYLTKSADDQKKWVQNSTAIPAFDIVNFKLNMLNEETPEIGVSLALKLNRFASVSGKRFFFTPNLMNRSNFIPEKLAERKTDIVIKTGYLDIDTIRYKLPDNVYPEFLPDTQKHTSRFGEYESSFQMDENGLLYIRKIKMKEGEYPASTYQELTDFYKSLNKSDNIKIVLLSKT
ncbi:DUF3857 domain-containing protein [Chryseotalea sanaruensis]|uniref:DUF3857 domain-containing protein n=1 Tax=Chryseotalea sanaruensis TaxID=2482724 RepID=A0A401U8D8_9BACT|nr:DUF3857 domain-containing protein [Chryseotalea sanaruensis]GCC51158.1 DUF3857 domain-containing protein [Chryseotalea sanaruensis]